ncbi:MAG: hypothetical protein RSE58_12175 [Clostridia bacterium]
MKKWIAMAAVLLLVFSCVSVYAETVTDIKEFTASNKFDLLLATDVFINDDAEMDDKGNLPETIEKGAVCIQGCFGSIDMSKSEAEPFVTGFDPENIFSMTLAKDCVVLMPKDWTNPVENMAIEDPASWCEAIMAETDPDKRAVYLPFYASFEFNDNGELTKLEYCYMP